MGVIGWVFTIIGVLVIIAVCFLFYIGKQMSHG